MRLSLLHSFPLTPTLPPFRTPASPLAPAEQVSQRRSSTRSCVHLRRWPIRDEVPVVLPVRAVVVVRAPPQPGSVRPSNLLHLRSRDRGRCCLLLRHAAPRNPSRPLLHWGLQRLRCGSPGSGLRWRGVAPEQVPQRTLPSTAAPSSHHRPCFAASLSLSLSLLLLPPDQDRLIGCLI